MNTSVVFTKNVSTARVGLRGEKIGSYGPDIPIRVSGGGIVEIGSQITIKTWIMNSPSVPPGFEGWYDDKNNFLSGNEEYTFTVTEDVTITAKWMW